MWWHLALEVDRPDEIDFVELVGGPGLQAGILLTRQQRGEADPGAVKPLRCRTRSMVRRPGSGRTFRAFEFGEDGVGPDQAVPGARRGMCLKPPTDGEDGVPSSGEIRWATL